MPNRAEFPRMPNIHSHQRLRESVVEGSGPDRESALGDVLKLYP
jgi:hypothetical protein